VPLSSWPLTVCRVGFPFGFSIPLVYRAVHLTECQRAFGKRKQLLYSPLPQLYTGRGGEGDEHCKTWTTATFRAKIRLGMTDRPVSACSIVASLRHQVKWADEKLWSLCTERILRL